MKTIRTYSCAKCGGSVTKPPCVAPGDKSGKENAAISYSGLHGWSCENCGDERRFVSVVRDFSGGKEADKGARETPWSVSRPLKIAVKVFQQPN